MKAKMLNGPSEQTYILVFNSGDEFSSTLLQFAAQNNLTAAHFTAIGAFSDVTLGYFSHEQKTYEKIPLNEQVEVVSLVGDIAVLDDGTPAVHAHVVVGDSKGLAHGGHIIEAHVWPTLELILEESPDHLHRRIDPATGLALISI